MIPSTPQLLIVLIVFVVLAVIPYYVFGPVAAKAGFSKWWSVIMMLPIVNIIAVWVFAFAKWPARPNS